MGLGKKTILGIAMKDVRDAGFSLKRRGKCGLGSISPPPFQTLFITEEGGRRSTIDVPKNNKPEQDSDE